MSKADTAPAAETENAEPASIADLVSERHQALPDHEAHKEVGEDPDDEPAPAAAPAAKTAPAPVAEAAPAAKVETPVDPATKPETEQPFWYRKEIEKERRARQAAERRAADLEQRQPAPQQRQEPAGEGDDPERPLTRAELEFYRQRDALVGRLERSEERFVDKLGEETFEATREWLTTRPDIEEWALKQRDPWRAAHSQFTKEKLAAEIGEDPNAWREAERERMRQELRAEMDAEAQHIPARRDPPQMRSAPPAAASTARSAAPRDDSGRFAPAPLTSLTKNKFG
jgi:hypothetical protein